MTNASLLCIIATFPCCIIQASSVDESWPPSWLTGAWQIQSMTVTQDGEVLNAPEPTWIVFTENYSFEVYADVAVKAYRKRASRVANREVVLVHDDSNTHYLGGIVKITVEGLIATLVGSKKFRLGTKTSPQKQLRTKMVLKHVVDKEGLPDEFLSAFNKMSERPTEWLPAAAEQELAHWLRQNNGMNSKSPNESGLQ